MYFIITKTLYHTVVIIKTNTILILTYINMIYVEKGNLKNYNIINTWKVRFIL